MLFCTNAKDTFNGFVKKRKCSDEIQTMPFERQGNN